MDDDRAHRLYTIAACAQGEDYCGPDRGHKCDGCQSDGTREVRTNIVVVPEGLWAWVEARPNLSNRRCQGTRWLPTRKSGVIAACRGCADCVEPPPPPSWIGWESPLSDPPGDVLAAAETLRRGGHRRPNPGEVAQDWKAWT